MTRLSKKKHRAAVYGFVKWIPVLIAIFSVAFIDIMLNVESRKVDYQLGELTEEHNALLRTQEELGLKSEIRANVNRLNALAPELGMRQALADESVRIVAVPEAPDSVFAMEQVATPVLDAPVMSYEVAASIVDDLPEAPAPVVTSLDESPEAMLASL